jgi:hypothetical protein
VVRLLNRRHGGRRRLVIIVEIVLDPRRGLQIVCPVKDINGKGDDASRKHQRISEIHSGISGSEQCVDSGQVQGVGLESDLSVGGLDDPLDCGIMDSAGWHH